jgi:hypothetical protein
MKSHWRQLAALLPLNLEKKVYQLFFQTNYNQWAKGERTLPPPHLLKQKLIRDYAEANEISILVETGTYLGDMVFAMHEYFKEIYSVELSPIFYQKAIRRFKKFENVKILQGDSGKILQILVQQLKAPALFWLDGHYSGGQTAKGDKECPIYEELDHIFSSHFNHTIIIDDARLFVGTNDYPTVDELRKFVRMHRSSADFELKNDAIIITYK